MGERRQSKAGGIILIRLLHRYGEDDSPYRRTRIALARARHNDTLARESCQLPDLSVSSLQSGAQLWSSSAVPLQSSGPNHAAVPPQRPSNPDINAEPTHTPPIFCSSLHREGISPAGDRQGTPPPAQPLGEDPSSFLCPDCAMLFALRGRGERLPRLAGMGVRGWAPIFFALVCNAVCSLPRL